MTGKWYVWLTGSNTYTAPDDDSEVLLTSLPIPLQTVSTSNWLKLYPEGIETLYESWADNSVAQRHRYVVRLRPFEYPSEAADRAEIYETLRYRNIYLCMDGDGQSASTKYDERIHTAGSCLALRNESGPPSYNYENGYVEVTLEFSKIMPII